MVGKVFLPGLLPALRAALLIVFSKFPYSNR